MAFFSAEMEPMIDIFQSETLELIGSMEQALMAAEKQRAITPDAINELFRVVHTIKSSAAMMGMDDLSQVTHRLEDCFHIFRDEPNKIDGELDQVMDVLYQYVAYVNQEMAQVDQPSFEPTPMPLLSKAVNELFDHCQTDSTPPSDTQEKENTKQVQEVQTSEDAPSASSAPPEGTGQSQTLRISFQENCRMANVRAYMLVTQLKPLCVSITHVPSNLDTDGAAKVVLENGLLLNVLTTQMDTVYSKIGASAYVSKFETIDDSEEDDDTANQEEDSSALQPEIKAKVSKHGSIDWDKIIQLQDVTGELITIENRLENIAQKIENNNDLEAILHNQKRLLADLEALVISVSLLSVSVAVPQLYHIVRDIARDEGKQVEFKVVGEDIEIDKTVMDAMMPPLIHIIRNAIDHGIESPDEREKSGKSAVGHVTLTVENAGGTLTFTITDDGKGLDSKQILEKAKVKDLLEKPEDEYQENEIFEFIYKPGFSTRKQASTYSGRGVGMDVAIRNVSDLGGVLTLESTYGKGTSFIIKLPVSMASVDSIVFNIGCWTGLIPTRSIQSVSALSDIRDHFVTVNGQQMYKNDNQFIPVLNLGEVLKIESGELTNLLLIEAMNGTIGLCIGEVIGQQNAVEKALCAAFGANYRTQTAIRGTVVLGSGDIGLMFHPEQLVQIAMKNGKTSNEK